MSNYRIERLIGIGGAAVVYEARPLLPGGDGPAVACKLMRAELRANQAARALVRREAALGLRITPCHPGLARVLDCFEDADGRLCIVMELVDGGSLKALLGSGPRLSFPCTRRIVWEVLQALDCLHGLDVLHRDLSPCNILISTSGAVKIADLGIAREMEQGQFFTRNYRGKLAYDSPEGIQTQILDARSDLYALGAVLYELLAGNPPCGETDDWATIVKQTLLGGVAPLPPDLPADLAGLAMGLLRTDRDAREPQSAGEALVWLSDQGQPMASTAELAAMVMARKSRRDGEPDHAHRASSLGPEDWLAPGHVLVAHEMSEPGQPTPAAETAQPLEPSHRERTGEGATGDTPEAETAQPSESAQELVFPLPAEPPLPPLPQPPLSQRSPPPPEQQSRQPRSQRSPQPLPPQQRLPQPPEQEQRSRQPRSQRSPQQRLPPAPEQRSRQPRSQQQRSLPPQSSQQPGPPGTPGPSRRPRRVTAHLASPHQPRRRAAGRMLLAVCVLVSGFLLHDRFRGEPDTVLVAPPGPPAPDTVLVAPPGPPAPDDDLVQQQPARPAPVPGPARLTELAPSAPGTPERPVRVAVPAAELPPGPDRERADDAPPVRSGKRRPSRSVRPVERRWEPVVRRSERSTWAIP